MGTMDASTQPTPASSSVRHDARRQEIIDIAARLFAERGYHATSIDDLSQATGLKRGGLYHYIGSKENLLFSIHERVITPLLEEAQAIESRDDPPEATLRALTHAMIRNIATYRDQVTVFLHEWRSVVSSDDPRQGEVRAARHEFEAVIERTLERGAVEGVFAVEDPKLTVLAFLGMINYTYQWYRPGGGAEPDAIADAFSDIFLRGVLLR